MKRNFQYNLLLNLLHILPILSILLCLLPQAATAGIFDPPHTDKSIEYLGVVFGGSLGNINLGLTQGSNHVLTHLFQIFNGIILAVAMFILSYVGIVSTVNTAQEGQVMGKKWSSVWIPLRSTMGLLLLAPVPGTGYSLLQVTIMWIVLNGVGAADKLWNVILLHLANGVSVTQNININDSGTSPNSNQENEVDSVKLITNGKKLSKQLLNNLVCLAIIDKHVDKQELHKRSATLNYHFTNIKIIKGDEPSVTETLMFGVNDSAIPSRQDVCGHINIKTSLNNNDKILLDGINAAHKQRIVEHIHYKRRNTLINMIDVLRPHATAIANTTPDANGQINLNSVLDPKILLPAIIIYQKTMSGLSRGPLMAFINLHLNEHPLIKNIKTVIDNGEKYGWITAGSFYYLFSKSNPQSLMSSALDIPTSEQADPFGDNNIWFTGTIGNPGKVNTATLGVQASNFTPYIDSIRNINFDDNSFLNVAAKINPLSKDDFNDFYKHTNNFGIPDPEELQQGVENDIKDSLNRLNINQEAKDTLYQLQKSATSGFKAILYNDLDGDPLIALAKFGMQLMNAAETCFGLIIHGSLETLAKKPSAINLVASIQNLPSIFLGLAPILLIIAATMWTLGASLAIYSPMVPYFMFIVTALSWFMLVIEAIIAAPIVALGLITPAQEELGKIVPALGIIANIFLRPILMIIGLIMGAKIFKAALSMVNLGFEFSLSLLKAQTGTSLFSWIVEAILYTAFILTLINKCYALIYQVPDKILRWIGVTGEPTDVSSIKETQQTFDQQSKQVIEPAQGAAKTGLEEVNKKIAKDKKDGSGLGSQP